ncbi:profilin-1A-like [Dendronephthya gigantea]|uniref:profilin-1A-like n=1 Tax=Dendronephthya gigantea TaxID=151771 RepID=UPI00106CFA60|nr:profilin-1A-like [Dendronephthya gigantea]
MIWQSFVDETILGTSQVAKAAIHGLNGTRFAASTGFVIPNCEIQDIVTAITTDPSKLYSSGITLGQAKFSFLRIDPGRAILFRNRQEGGIAVKTNRCLIIGTYNEGMEFADCCSVIETLADHFIMVEY